MYKKINILILSCFFIKSAAAQQVLPPPSPIFSDPQTGIQWRRHIGQTGNKNIHGNTWNEVRNIPDTANQFSMLGYSDWRLPTLEELETLHTKEPSRALGEGGIYLHPQIYGDLKTLWSNQYHPETKNPCAMTFSSSLKVECSAEGSAGILLVRDMRAAVLGNTASSVTRNPQNPNIFDATLYGTVEHDYPVEAWMELNDQGKYGRGMHLGVFSVSLTGLPCNTAFTYRTVLYWNGRTLADPDKKTFKTGACVKAGK